MEADFDEWARARSGALLRAAFLLTGDQHHAEDLVQETLVRVALSWRRIENAPDAYAQRILYRLQVARWRRSRLRETPTPSPPETGQPDLSASVDLRLALGDALARLTRRQRAVLVLRYYEDRSEAEAAAILGCSVGTVKSQTHKAIAALRQSSRELSDIIVEPVDSDG